MEKSMHVSYSQLQVWRRCRRKWYFSYVEQLRSKEPAYALWLGAGIHEVLDFYYKLTPAARSKAALLAAYETWAWGQRDKLVVETHGSLLAPQILLDADKNIELGRAMMTHYGEAAPDLDKDMLVVSTEQEFNLPLGATAKTVDEETGEFIDIPVTYKGRIDGIIQLRSTGKYYLLEHKTATQFNEKRLVLDQQATSYIWAAEKLSGLEISGVFYNILRKQAPGPRVKNPLIYRLYVERSRDAILGFPAHVRMIIRDMELASENDLYYHTPGDDCSYCPYFTVCAMIQDAANPRDYIREYFKKEEKEELPAEIQEA